LCDWRLLFSCASTVESSFSAILCGNSGIEVVDAGDVRGGSMGGSLNVVVVVVVVFVAASGSLGGA
jgi:hypothetical protein